jgi:hypothetical protein
LLSVSSGDICSAVWKKVRVPSSENPSMLASNAPFPAVALVDSQFVTL